MWCKIVKCKFSSIETTLNRYGSLHSKTCVFFIESIERVQSGVWCGSYEEGMPNYSWIQTPSPQMQTPWMQTHLDVLPVLQMQSPLDAGSLHADLLGCRTTFLGRPKDVDPLDADPLPSGCRPPLGRPQMKTLPDADPPRCRPCPPCRPPPCRQTSPWTDKDL